MAYRIFVSYSSKDSPVVEQIQGLLSGTGIEVFVAEHSVRPGEPLAPRLSRLERVLTPSPSQSVSWD